MKQAQALTVMLGGESVFLTGAPGAGKTFILNEFIRRSKSRGKSVAVTASTGIAATHIGGVTIHSWSGLGIKEFIDAVIRQQLTGNIRLSKRYNSTDILVIDEVSMLHGKRLGMVNEVCKLLRKNDEPFGGLQVILVGDLFQLPPVTRDSDELDFAHLSEAWAELNPQICYLNEQHRQTGDGLLDLLEAMRSGEIEAHHEELLQERMGQRPESSRAVTRLYAHNADIDTVNQRHLSALNDETRQYEMTTKGSAAKVEQLKRGVLAPEILELKTGAEVMFVANNPSARFFNGTRGRVVGFRENQPVAELAGGRKIVVSPHSWKLEEDGKIRAEVTQLPLRLAWAITIHKSQGMSLDAAEIDLGKTFTPGMGYVALSRVRNLDGLFLVGINNMALQMHPQIYEFDRGLRSASASLAVTVSDAQEEAPQAEQEQGTELGEPPANQGLLAKLKQWRLKRARADSIPAYIIAHDSILELVATKLPDSLQTLLRLKGFGDRKVEQYGAEILEVVKPYLPDPVSVDKQATDDTRPSDLAQYRQETIAQYPNAFKHWNSDEESLLLDLFWQSLPLEQICAVLERQPSGVWARLHKILSEQSAD